MTPIVVIIVYPLSHVQPFATPWTATHQASLCMGFPRQEYWSGLPFPFPEDLLDQRSKPCLLHWQANSSPLSHQGRPMTPIDWADFVHKNPGISPKIILPTRNLETLKSLVNWKSDTCIQHSRKGAAIRLSLPWFSLGSLNSSTKEVVVGHPERPAKRKNSEHRSPWLRAPQGTNAAQLRCHRMLQWWHCHYRCTI